MPILTHEFRLDRWQRKGQFCRIVKKNNYRVCVEFADGERRVVGLSAIRRRKEFKLSLTQQQQVSGSAVSRQQNMTSGPALTPQSSA